jgi:Transposase DDE domain
LSHAFGTFARGLIKSKKCDFLIKVSQNVKLPVMSDGRLPDGSYLTQINGKSLDIKNSTEKHRKWKKETLIVRAIEYQIPGFRPCRLITSILAPEISAKQLVIHYHKRWDVEISFESFGIKKCCQDVTATGT